MSTVVKINKIDTKGWNLSQGICAGFPPLNMFEDMQTSKYKQLCEVISIAHVQMCICCSAW